MTPLGVCSDRARKPEPTLVITRIHLEGTCDHIQGLLFVACTKRLNSLLKQLVCFGID
jgi:hypothetical protein